MFRVCLTLTLTVVLYAQVQKLALYSIHYNTQKHQENHLRFDHFSRQAWNEDFFISCFKTWSNVWNIFAAQTSLCVENVFLFFFRQSDAPRFADNKRRWCWFSQNLGSTVRQNLGRSCWLHKSFHLKTLPFWQPEVFYTCPSPCLSLSHLSQSIFSSLPLLHTHNNSTTPLKSIKPSIRKARGNRSRLIYRRTPASSPSLIKAWSERRRGDTQQDGIWLIFTEASCWSDGPFSLTFIKQRKRGWIGFPILSVMIQTGSKGAWQLWKRSSTSFIQSVKSQPIIATVRSEWPVFIQKQTMQKELTALLLLLSSTSNQWFIKWQ